MGETVGAILVLRLISELAALAERAIRAGGDVSKAELDSAFARADMAEAQWAKVRRTADEGGGR